MTAGRGIVHSERTPPEIRAHESRLFGIQSWVALPKQHEEVAPDFAHHGADALPLLEDRGVRVRVIAGELMGARSPAATRSDVLYADVTLDAGARFALPTRTEERGVYIVEGSYRSMASRARSTPDGSSCFGPVRPLRWSPAILQRA